VQNKSRKEKSKKKKIKKTKREQKRNENILLTWNEAVNAEMISYVFSQGCLGAGRKGVRMYWRPSRGTKSSVALKQD